MLLKLRYHKNLIQAIVDALQGIFKENKYADLVIEKTLKSNKKWGSKDRRFIAETVYDIVRFWRLLWYVNESDVILDDENLTKLIQSYLYLFKHDENFFISGFNSNAILKKSEEAKNIRVIRESIPDWLDELGTRELGEDWETELKALNDKARVVLRTNTLKTSKENLQNLLKTEEIETHPLPFASEALVLKDRKNVFSSLLFKQGLFEVQDAVSQLVSPFLDVREGMRVVDACAGGGGKSLHLAALMKNKGTIIAMDVEQWKLNELRRRANRNGITNIETRYIDSLKVIKKLKYSADRLLLDVPCSGIGVLKRNPDAKWKLTKERIAALNAEQEKILKEYSIMVKPQGIIVYSTCSLLPSENRNQVEKFLLYNSKFKLIDEKTYLPSITGYDGFYMAKLLRNE